MEDWSYQYAMNCGRKLIREGFVVAAVCMWWAVIFGALAASGAGGADAASTAWMGTILFTMIGLAYGTQAFVFKYKLRKAMRDG